MMSIDNPGSIRVSEDPVWNQSQGVDLNQHAGVIAAIASHLPGLDLDEDDFPDLLPISQAAQLLVSECPIAKRKRRAAQAAGVRQSVDASTG